MKNLDLHRELKEQGSVLSKIAKRYIVDSTSIPNGYFESMETRFMNSIKQDQPRAATGFNWARFSTSAGLAAVLIAGMVVVFNFLNTEKTTPSSLSKNEVLDYLETENIYQEPQMLTKNEADVSLDNLSKEEIKNYFLENGIYDVNTLESI